MERSPKGKTADLPSRFPVVGVGASAGGLAAFESFFTALRSSPPTGMAFALVQHLAPDHKSLLCELIKGFTSMEVFEVEDGTCVGWRVPPRADLTVPPPAWRRESTSSGLAASRPEAATTRPASTQDGECIANDRAADQRSA